MLLPSIVDYQHPKYENFTYAIPSRVTYEPVPADAIGSIAWVEGIRESRLCVIIALANGGRWVALVDTEGGFIRCSHRKVNFLGPTRFRALAAIELRKRGLPVARR
jgi:hypothetical protein